MAFERGPAGYENSRAGPRTPSSASAPHADQSAWQALWPCSFPTDLHAQKNQGFQKYRTPQQGGKAKRSREAKRQLPIDATSSCCLDSYRLWNEMEIVLRWPLATDLATILFILEQLVLKTVDQGQPTCFNDIFADAHRAPHVVAVPRLDHHPNSGGCASAGVDHPHLVIDQTHLGQVRKDRLQGLAKSAVQSVDRTVAFAHRVHDLFADLHFDGGFGPRPI